jgi:hypothetical protein
MDSHRNSADSPQTVLGLPQDSLWTVHRLSPDCVRTPNRLPMDSMDCLRTPRTVEGLSTDFHRTVYRLSTDCPLTPTRSMGQCKIQVAEMIGRALALKPVLYDLCDQVQFNKREGVRLHKYIIQDDVLEELWPLLDVHFAFIHLGTMLIMDVRFFCSSRKRF